MKWFAVNTANRQKSFGGRSDECLLHGSQFRQRYISDFYRNILLGCDFKNMFACDASQHAILRRDQYPLCCHEEDICPRALTKLPAYMV